MYIVCLSAFNVNTRMYAELPPHALRPRMDQPGRDPSRRAALITGRYCGKLDFGRAQPQIPIVRSVILVSASGADRFRRGLRNSRCMPRCGFLVKPFANFSCERQQLRSGGLSPAYFTPLGACAGGDGVAITGSRCTRA